VPLAPDGNDLAEEQHLKDVAAEWGRHMARATLRCTDAEFSLQQVLSPKLLYPLTATSCNEGQYYDILKQALAAALPAMGIYRKFPKAVVHSPRSHQGLDLPNLFTEQLMVHVMTILRFGLQQDDPMGHLLKANAEAFCLEARLSGQVFQMPLVIIDYMTPTWFTQTWINCRLLDIKISMDIHDYEKPRKHNREIMQIFIQHGITGNELAAMDQCRMYIQAIFYWIYVQAMELRLTHITGEGTFVIHLSDGPEQKDPQTTTGISGKVT